jgi:hypothetical protein
LRYVSPGTLPGDPGPPSPLTNRSMVQARSLFSCPREVRLEGLGESVHCIDHGILNAGTSGLVHKPPGLSAPNGHGRRFFHPTAPRRARFRISARSLPFGCEERRRYVRSHPCRRCRCKARRPLRLAERNFPNLYSGRKIGNPIPYKRRRFAGS